MKFLFKYRLFCIVVILAGCIGGAKFVLLTLQPSNAISIWFAKNDPALKSYYDFQRQFGNDRIIVLAFKQNNGILNPETLKKVEKLTNQLPGIAGVKDVLSVINAKDFRKIKQNDTIRIRFVNWFKDNPDYIVSTQLKKELLSSPLIANKVINKSGTVTLLVIRLAPLQQIDNKTGTIISQIESISQKILGAENVHLSGMDIITNGLNRLSKRDFTLFTALAFGFMFLIIGFFYRKLAYLILVFLVSLTSIWISLVIHGLLGFRINIFTVISPPLIITLGIISLLHIINEYELSLIKHPGENTVKLASQALVNIFKPCFFATLTTIIGFSSLFTSSSSVIKEFAFLSSLGIFLLFIFSFVFCSILLPLQKKSVGSGSGKIGSLLSAFSRHVLNYSRIYTLASVVLVVIFIFGISRINNDMHPLGFFPKNHQVVKDHQFMLDNWGDYYPIDMVLNTDTIYHLGKPETVRALVNFGREIESNPMVKDRFDYSQIMQRYAQVVFRKDLGEILNDPFIAERFVDQFMQQLKDHAGNLISNDFTKARITIMGPFLSIRKLEENLKIIDTIAEKHFKEPLFLSVTGYPALYIKIMNYAFYSMESSLYSCFILIFISMALLLRSIRIALIAIVPNVFPVIILLGFLGLTGINLDLATCTVAAIVMGISVDDTIFFLHHYQKTKSAGNTLQENITRTHHHVGRVILLSSLVMLAGFSIMLFASLKTVFFFGLLAIVSVVAAALGDLIILPLLLKFTDGRKWWKTK